MLLCLKNNNHTWLYYKCPGSRTVEVQVLLPQSPPSDCDRKIQAGGRTAQSDEEDQQSDAPYRDLFSMHLRRSPQSNRRASSVANEHNHWLGLALAWALR